MSSSSRRLLAVGSVVAVAAFAGGYATRAIGRPCAHATPAAPATRSASTPTARAADARVFLGPAPAGSLLPEAGSIYRNRLAATEVPLEGGEVVLLSSNDEECVEGCPLSLRVVGGPIGGRRVQEVAASLAVNIENLAASAGTPASLASKLRGLHAEFGARLDAAGPAARPPLRAMFMGLPRPELGRGTWSVGLALYDYPDPHFDAARPEFGTKQGVHLLVARVEREAADGDRPDLVSGAIEVGKRTEDVRTSPPSPDDKTLRFVYSSLWMHFGGVLPQVEGLYLDPDQRIYSYAGDLRLQPVPDSPALRRALIALLRRA